MQHLPDVYALTKDEGQAIWFLNTLVFVKATGTQTGGCFWVDRRNMSGWHRVSISHASQ